MSAFSTRVVVFFGVFCASAIAAGAFDRNAVTTWANDAGVKLLSFFNTTTKYYKLQERYRETSPLSVSKQHGSKIVRNMASRLQEILQNKIQSIKNLANKTAEVRHKYTFNPSLKKVDYLHAKELPEEYFKIDPKFSQSIKINKNGSVVHIPTDVYSGGRKILNTIAWTNGLDPVFKDNDKDNPSLLWQYFGSSDGVYRVYPGFKWRNEGQDVYDNRRRGWYIQGSSSPKDLVLLLDLSGRMAGQKLAIVKLAAMSLLETLQENDFVNIVIVYSNKDIDDKDKVQPYMICQVLDTSDENLVDTKEKNKAKNCSLDFLLQATQQNKKYLKNFVPKLKARGMAAFDDGFEFAIELLKNSKNNGNTTSSGCSQSIILFTDGIEESQAQLTRDVLKEKNADKKIRVFTYLVGREKSATDQPLKKISADYYGCTFRIQTLSDVREKVLEYVKILSRPVGFATADSDPVTSWTPIYLDRLGLGLMITLVAPVFNKSNSGELLGVVGTDVALPQLEGSVPRSEVGVNGYGFVINNNGFVLFHPGLDREKDPPNIALDQVEFNSSQAKELMREMISRKTGKMTFINRVISSNKHRISWSEEFHYFYSPIADTSFSAAVAIPKSSMNFSVDYPLDDKEVLKSKSDEFVIVAPWQICRKTPVAASNTTPVYQPSYATAQDIINDVNYKDNCNDTKLKNLLFDANITKELAGSWSGKDGIESIFVATGGGIMRWLNFSSLSSPLKRNFIKEEFYTKAAQFAQFTRSIEKPTVVFSARYRERGYKADVNETSINASSPVILLEGTDRFVVAVLGMEISETKLNEVLFSNDTLITATGCNDGSDCVVRVIDDDGFIIATNQKEGSESEVGMSFADDERCVMQELVNNASFESLEFTSIQEKCDKSDNTGDSSSARTLLNPLFAVSAYVQFWTQTVFWSLAQFNIYSFFSPRASAMAENEGSETSKMIPCSKKLPFYKAVLESENKVFNCEDSTSSCCRSFVIAAIPHTNLRLVVIKQCDTCDSQSSASTTTEDSQDDQPKPFRTNFRLRPHLPCYDRTEDEKPPCALASLASSYFAVVIFSLIVALGADNWR
ncbi:voltage-dependent calcium channel subunit alpha-2/delta-2-like isoform X2 [Acropora millepora]|uniref:voltage-dependent calcium channel subunit alpha-2/delta-2-like isoform X2 n=1 Tax=Acropora millepora TaxID=45264 RepID=UPI001CF5CC41|nr:voltage-dependent calcium channel subunit alpha-2/delta-2-like isoform X2 [Acropora millepora]